MATRSHGLTAAITALIAMALAATVAGRGCNKEEDGATEAVRAFLAASAAGRRDAVLGMLGPKTLARRQEAALRTTKIVGGEGRYAARDMLQMNNGGPTAVSIVNMGRDGDQASISLTDALGVKTTVIAVRLDGVWKLELEPSP